MHGVYDQGSQGRTHGPVEIAVNKNGDQVSFPKPNILVVDDSPQNLLAMAQMLESLDANIIQARSGADALRCLLRQDIAIILLDIQMPTMDGYELAALIRKRERSCHTPIIFITAFSRDDQDVARGYALGAVDFVFKPVDPVVLRAKVSVFVELHRKNYAIHEQARLERELQIEALRARTEKIEAQRALRQSEERQAVIVRSLPIALYTAGLNGSFSGPRFLSEAIADLVGFPARAFVDDEDLWRARIHPDDMPRVQTQVESIATDGSFSAEYRWRCADDSERIFLDQAVQTRSDDGTPLQIVGTCFDVTERRQLEQQLVHSQKMEALGKLTGGIAHDFNNMLSVIIWNLDLIARSIDGEGKNYMRTQNALGAALNCAELVRQLLTFARNQAQRPKSVDLADLVPRMARLLGPELGEVVKLEVKLGEGIWPVFADPAQIESALLNLAINSRDAMPGGGTLTIDAANFPCDEGGPDLAAGDYVAISVTDTGAGMTKEVLDRAFEPFFTTKEPGSGSGLGLSMVYGMVKQAGGHARIDSAPGAGTAVRLYLPRSTGAVVEEFVRQETDAGALSAGRIILVVEDNASVRGMTVTRLEDMGHRVLAAEAGPVALEILTGDTHIDLLFTDIVMPGGMTGFELARKALVLRPAIKVLFASAHASSFPEVAANTEFLQKPYRDDDLRRALQRIFGAAASEDPPQDGPLAAEIA